MSRSPLSTPETKVNLLRRLYRWVESQASSPYASLSLFLLAFTEAIFFPIPADVLLIALAVSQPRRAFSFAAICTLGSVLGAGLGYAIGYYSWYTAPSEFSQLAHFFFDVIPGFTPDRFHLVQELYQKHDFWAIFIAGFTPLPYKVFTITAGVFNINFFTFMIASILSRGARFFLVGGLFFFFGAPIHAFIERHLEKLTVALLLLLGLGYLLLKGI